MNNQQPTRMQNMLRENTIYRYMNALEVGDIDTVEAVLQEAERDDILEGMITGLHKAYRIEEDAAGHVKNVAFVHQLLQQYQKVEHEGVQIVQTSQEKSTRISRTTLEQENGMPSNPKVAKNTFFNRLKEVGFDKGFVMQKLLPKSLAVKLQGQKVTEETGILVQQAVAIVESVFNWDPGTLFGSTPLPVNMATVGTTRFKKNVDSDIEHIGAYTLYAHHLALLVLQVTANLPRKPIPTDPEVVRRDVLTMYGTFTFEHVLQYVWSLGVPVLPLNDKGVFHGACWRVNHRNVIVLKQRTMSDSRWLFDLLHELRHAGQDTDKDQFAVIEASDDTQEVQIAEEEKTASQFAGNVILDGRAEELIDMCVKSAGNIPRLKRVVPVIAQREHVSIDALANYMAFRLSLQNEDWWGAANNLQIPSTAAWQISRDFLLRNANFEILDEANRDLLLRALSDTEV